MQEGSKRGKRGGTTTVYPDTGRHRKTIYLYEEEVEALRRHEYEKNESASQVVRRALRKELGLPPDERDEPK
jgi:hypothetical protein